MLDGFHANVQHIKNLFTLTSRGSPLSSSSIIVRLWHTSIPLYIRVSLNLVTSFSGWPNFPLPSCTTTPIMSSPSSVKVPVYIQVHTLRNICLKICKCGKIVYIRIYSRIAMWTYFFVGACAK